MAALTIASKGDQAKTLPALLVAQYAKESDSNATIDVSFKDADKLTSEAGTALELKLRKSAPLYDPKEIIQSLLESFQLLQDKNEVLVQEWIDRAGGFSTTDFKSVEKPLFELDSHLTLRSYIIGYSLSVADLVVWGAIRGNKFATGAVKKGSMLNLTRWYKFIEETISWIQSTIQSLNAYSQEKKMAKSKEGASYDIALPNTEKGVVTRFPPEPS